MTGPVHNIPLVHLFDVQFRLKVACTAVGGRRTSRDERDLPLKTPPGFRTSLAKECACANCNSQPRTFNQINQPLSHREGDMFPATRNDGWTSIRCWTWLAWFELAMLMFFPRARCCTRCLRASYRWKIGENTIAGLNHVSQSGPPTDWSPLVFTYVS